MGEEGGASCDCSSVDHSGLCENKGSSHCILEMMKEIWDAC